MEYTLHEIQWTDAKVSRFWDYENSRKNQDSWFTFQVGDGIWNFAKKFIDVNESTRILDYGAGKGLLSKIILENSPATVDCTEFSPLGLENINANLQSQPRFGKAILVNELPSQIPASSYDVVFFTEAIEHLTEEYYLPTLTEFRRLLKPGGIVIVTTPNDEDLELSKVCCPDCGSIFHRVQHMRSFTAAGLSGLLKGIGFDTKFSGAINFWNFKNNISLKKRALTWLLKNVLKRDMKQPHLVFIGVNNKQS